MKGFGEHTNEEKIIIIYIVNDNDFFAGNDFLHKSSVGE